MVQLLVSFKVSNQTQNAIQQCFDTITEVVQGPCKLNQNRIIQTKFLEYAINLLREEPSVYDYVEEALEP